MLFPGDGALQTLWLPPGARGLWVPVLLPEFAAATPDVWVSAAGAKGHIYSGQAQVGPQWLRTYMIDLYPLLVQLHCR